MSRLGHNPLVLWSSFIVAHLWLGLVNLYGPGLPLGDVTNVYKYWTDQIFLNGFWVGIDSAWVYPVLAIFPMLAAAAFGQTLIASTWLSMILMLNAAAFFVLTGRRRRSRNHVAAWWWIGFVILLGPIALGRIDSVTVPIAIIGVLLIARRPALASVILTVAAWIKVWPVALITAAVIATKVRWRIVVAAAGFSVGIVGVAVLFGGGANVFSFVGQQAGRGLQVESPISTIWMWQAFSGLAGASVYYDQHILTWQVSGNGTTTASALMTPIMLLAVTAVVLMALLALRRGAPADALLATTALGLVSVLIAFNKVGSPQFIAWLAVPIVLGLTTRYREDRRWFAVPAWMVLVTAALTQVIYPFLYAWLLVLNPIMLIVLTARNLLVFVIVGWAVLTLARLGTESPDPSEFVNTVSEPTRWPLQSQA